MTSTPPPGFGPRWGDLSARTPAPQPAAAGGGPATPPVDPLSRRLLQLAGVLAVILLAVIANAWLHSDEGNPFNPIAQAAQRTQRLPGARADLEIVYSSEALPEPVVATGETEYNSETGRGRATLSLASSTQGNLEVESVGDETTVYVRSSAFAGHLPAGREWIGVEPWLGHTQEEALVGSDGARSEVEMMQAVSGQVDFLGHERVRGIPTRRYHGSVDLDRYASLLGAEGKSDLAEEYEALEKLISVPIEVEAWIDRRGIVRQERVVMTQAGVDGGPGLTMDMRIDLVKLGVSPDIQLPEGDLVYDETPQLRAQLRGLSG